MLSFITVIVTIIVSSSACLPANECTPTYVQNDITVQSLQIICNDTGKYWVWYTGEACETPDEVDSYSVSIPDEVDCGGTATCSSYLKRKTYEIDSPSDVTCATKKNTYYHEEVLPIGCGYVATFEDYSYCYECTSSSWTAYEYSGPECTGNIVNTIGPQGGCRTDGRGVEEVLHCGNTARCPGATPESSAVVTDGEASENQCVYRENYFIEGNQAYACGDPHFRMWNGDYHDFQGSGTNINDQYYYITHRKGSSTTDLPFNLLGKHYYYDENQILQAIDYITLQLFDSNNDVYLIFLQTDLRAYTPNANSSTESTLYDKNDTTLREFVTGTPVKLGKFTATVTKSTSWRLDFTLKIGIFCEISLYMTSWGVMKTDLNPPRKLQNLYINPPNCFQCFITGLFGDFKKTKIGPSRWVEGGASRIPLCDGINYKRIKAGWTPQYGSHDTAFDEYGLTYKVGYNCDDLSPGRRLLDTYSSLTSSNYELKPAEDFVYIEQCPSDSEIAQLTKTECLNTRMQYDNTVCKSEALQNVCDSLQSACEYDACVAASGNVTRVPIEVEDMFGRTLGFLESIPNIEELYDPTKLIAAPTNNPTTAPTIVDETDASPTQLGLMSLILSIFMFQIII